MSKFQSAQLEDDIIIEMILYRESKDEGFRHLMIKYQERLYYHIRRMLNSHEDTDDVLQNTFIKIFKNLENFKGDSQLYSWMYRIATNETLTYLRKNKKRALQVYDSDTLEITKTLKADPYFDGNEAQILLMEAIQSLPDRQKLVFNMRYYDEMSYADISSALKTSEGSLKASFHHALKKIENHLKNSQ